MNKWLKHAVADTPKWLSYEVQAKNTVNLVSFCHSFIPGCVDSDIVEKGTFPEIIIEQLIGLERVGVHCRDVDSWLQDS